jgi:hypothetical protein
MCFRRHCIVFCSAADVNLQTFNLYKQTICLRATRFPNELPCETAEYRSVVQYTSTHKAQHRMMKKTARQQYKDTTTEFGAVM